jgi:hypothetical protein
MPSNPHFYTSLTLVMEWSIREIRMARTSLQLSECLFHGAHHSPIGPLGNAKNYQGVFRCSPNLCRSPPRFGLYRWSPEGVKHNLDSCSSKVKTGGIIARHDCNPDTFPGVVHAAIIFIGKRNINLEYLTQNGVLPIASWKGNDNKINPLK